MTKIERYEQEKEKHLARMRKIQARCDELDRLILEEENLAIIAMVRAEKIDLNDLAALLKGPCNHSEAPDFMKEDNYDEQEG